MAITENINVTSIRNCLFCNHPIKGRSDKKFCADECRSNYHLKKNQYTPTIGRVNRILKRNRGILKEVLGSGALIEIDKRVLEIMDFNFYYHTHHKKDETGNTYWCYEYGYRFHGNTCVVTSEIKKPPGVGGSALLISEIPTIIKPYPNIANPSLLFSLLK